MRHCVKRTPHEYSMFALGKRILPLSEVHSISCAADLMTREKLIEMVGKLCASHERLRQEFEGLDDILKTDCIKSFDCNGGSHSDACPHGK